MNRIVVILILFIFSVSYAVAGDVKIWDTKVGEDSNPWSLQNTNAWANKANWKQIPYGTTGIYTFTGNTLIENDYFWLFLPVKLCTGCQPMLYAKLPNGVIGENSVLYNTVWLPSGQGYFDDALKSFNVIKNQADELIFIRDAAGNSCCVNSVPAGTNVVQWRIKSNAAWIEVSPKTDIGYYVIGHHSGPHRFLNAVPSVESNNDWVHDPNPSGPYGLIDCGTSLSCSKFFTIPTTYIFGLFGLSGLGQFYAMMTIPKDPSTGKLTTSIYRQVANNYQGLGHLESFYATKNGANNAVYHAVVNQPNVFKWEIPNKAITSGSSYTASFKPAIAGKWRVTGRVNGVYYTQTRDVQASGSLIFTSPVSGTLEAVVMYLYDRNSATPSTVTTPMDIYRQIKGLPSITPIITPVVTTPKPTPTPTNSPTPTPTPTPVPTSPISSDPFADLISYLYKLISSLFVTNIQ